MECVVCGLQDPGLEGLEVKKKTFIVAGHLCLNEPICKHCFDIDGEPVMGTWAGNTVREDQWSDGEDHTFTEV